MRRLTLSAMALAWTALPASAYSNGYAYSRAITVANSVVASTQVNFPMLVSGTYSYLATAGNGGYVQNTVSFNSQTVPADLIFTSDAAGTIPLNWAVAGYTASTGAIEVWIQIPFISNGTVIYLFVGNSSVTTYQGSGSNTWKDGFFTSVYPLPNGSTLSETDYGPNGYNGSVTGSGLAAVAGEIGGGMSAGGAGYVDTGNGQFPITHSFTFQAWVNASNWGQNSGIAGQGLDGFGNGWNIQLDLQSTCSKPVFSTVFGASVTGAACNPFSANTWHMITGTYNSGSGLTTLYQDGAPVASASATNSGRSSTEGVVIGYSNAGYFNGRLDQVEISNLDRSANWIAAEYNNQHSPSTFYTIGPITLPQAGTGVVTAVIIM